MKYSLALLLVLSGCSAHKHAQPKLVVAPEDAILRCEGGELDANGKLHCKRITAKILRYRVVQ